jgi:hypothetical protein
MQLLLSFMLSFSLNSLWGMMNGLAMIVYLPMFNLIFPSNFSMANDYLINIVTFDIIPMIDEINAYFFTTYYSEGDLSQPSLGYGLNGFENHNYAKNTGSFYIFTGWMIFSSLFFNIMRQFALNYYFVGFYRKYRMNENLNVLLMRLVLQGYVEMSISSLVTMQLISKLDVIVTSKNDTFCFFLGAFFWIYILILPIFMQRKLQ